MANEFPPVAALPNLTLHPSVVEEELDAADIVNGWLSSFTESLAKGQAAEISAHFLEKESWWRDLVSLSWDIACHNGAETIANYISSSTAGFRDLKADLPGALQPSLQDMGGMRFIQSGLSFKTDAGAGRGVLTLANVGPQQWKAWTVMTELERLNYQDELELRRAKEAETQSAASSHGAGPSSSQDDDDLQVLVVGAGESTTGGLFAEATLTNCAIRCIWAFSCCSPAKSRPQVPGRGQG